MSKNVEFVIVHNVMKQSGKTGTKLFLSEEALDETDESVIKLVSDLNDRYKNKSQLNSVFDDTATPLFHNEFKIFLNLKNKSAFTDFSKKAAVEFERRIVDNAPARGGFLVFAKYCDIKDYISVFFVRDTKGVLFQFKDKSYGINLIDHIDFEKMSMACRINLEMYKKASGDRYLSFINKTSDAASKYFTNWISASGGETNKEDTNNLYNLFKSLQPPLDEKGQPQTRDQFMDTVYKYISSAPSKQVDVVSLSKRFFKDELFLQNQIEEKNLTINTEFTAHPDVLARFAHIRAKAKGIELNFPQRLFQNTVRISETNPNQIIIDSKELAEKVASLANPKFGNQ